MQACPQCSAQVAAEDAFCGECGTRLEEAAARTEVQSAPSAPPPRPQPEAPAQEAAPAEPVAAAPERPGYGDSALLGEATPNQQYLGNRLSYTNAELFDPLGIGILARIFVQAVIFSVIYWIGFGILFLLFGTDGEAVYVLWSIAVGIGFWFSPIWTSISEWKLMLDSKASAHDAVFEHIAWVLRRRETPIARLKVQRLSLGGASRDYLYAQQGIFRIYVACFPFGRDLYVGWTMWWRISPFGWCWIVVVRLWHTLTLRGSELHNLHRYDNAKALREAVHAAAREGVDAAVGRIAFQGAGTIGSEVPIETTGQRRQALEWAPSS